MAERSARRTTRLRDALLAIGWALGGQAGARHCVAHAMPVCGTTLLSLLRRWGPVVKPTPRVLGVDDWSFQARSAGTLLVDLERHQPVEVLLGSDEQVHELAAEGKTQADIIRHLHLHRHTVRKYLHMPTFVAHYCSPHPSLVEPYRAYLEARWQQGEVMIKTLWHALQEQGLTGSYKSVWTFVRTWPLPAGMTPPSSSSSVAPSTRRGAPTIRTPRPRKMAVVASARGSECKGCCLSAGIVGPFPTPFVSLIPRSGRGFA